ncbi:Uncharacterised protein [Zhongshania aliphaticivorans]|uniref:Group 3 truncated hemoglobin ctb n=1 Tax=Zhongshania aliphaticivorans TaxID=1470434 RepID=A0A5S9QVH3_9GAMM|nr:group III truncated hemoglobin [Zhongshania aliphaticivorans]CAA0114851.1 Uncharacterised protein [Zhongshania aliphaticivorans]CAA0123040.1 Uncharacterised protein [Zhongshania aliphaticivorans]
MPTHKTDIRDHHDLEKLLRNFYREVLVDPIIGFYFTDVIPFSLEHHLPIVIRFWGQFLFNESQYQGQLFERHQNIHKQANLSPHHFERWLYLFNANIDHHFEGTNCQIIKIRAKRIADSMATALIKKTADRALLDGVHFYNPKT